MDTSPVMLLHAVFRDGKPPTLDLEKRTLGSLDPRSINIRRLQYGQAVDVWAWEFEARGADRERLLGELAERLRKEPEVCLIFFGRDWASISADELGPCTYRARHSQ